MKIIIILLLLLILTTESFAIDLNRRRTLWDMHHVSVSCIGTAYLNHVLEMPFWKAALTTIAIGIAWEGLDELYRKGKLGHKHDYIFDKRYGFDHQDLLRNTFGIAIAFPIRKIIKTKK